jgi:putative glycosyltransferase
MKLSIVSTLYYSSQYIEEFCDRIIKSIPSEFNDFEIIFVDDGSPDDSLTKAVKLKAKTPKIKILELSRNFGHHKAIMTGLREATGEYVFLIDVDLEEEPELLVDFWKEFKKDQLIDYVYGIQKKRKGGWFERWSGTIFYSLLNKVSETKIEKNTLIAKLMTKQFVQEMLRFKDKNVFLGGIIFLTGFNGKAFFCDKKNKGSTTYKFKIKLNQAINSFTFLSSKPLYIISYFGLTISLFSFVYILYLIINKIFYSTPLNGWTSTIASIYFSLGLIMIGIGVLGIYIGKIFDETKDRPYTIIKKRW